MTMSITIEELQKKWDRISPYSGGLFLVSDDHPLSFHIGYCGENMCFVVLNVEKKEEIISSKAISTNYIHMGNNNIALQFVLNYNSLKELFVKLCWDLMDSTKTSQDPLKDLLLRFRNWIILLQKRGDGVLASSTQKGIIAELLFLQEVLNVYAEDEVIDAWVGPEGSDQDFIFSDKWVEIKSVTIAATTFTISSLQQLDRDDDGELVVYFLDRTTSKGLKTVSLPEIINGTKQMLRKKRSKDLLECKLTMCGYDNKLAEQYQNIRFRFAKKHIYKITELFPRLIRDNVPDAVHNAIYELEINAIKKFLIQEN